MICRHIRRRACIEPPVHIGIAQHNLDIAARLVEGNDFDEFGRFPERPPGAPGVGSAGAGIVSGKRDFRFTVVGIQQLAEIVGSQLQIAIRDEQLRGPQTPDAEMPREFAPRGGHNLHQSVGVCVGNYFHIEF